MMMGYEHVDALIKASACVAELVRRVRPSVDWKPLSKKPHRWRPRHLVKVSVTMIEHEATGPVCT